MPTLFMPWHEFFDEIEKQTGEKEWLRSALFNDRGALVDASPAPTSDKPRRSVPPLFRLRRDIECTDLRGTQCNRNSCDGKEICHEQFAIQKPLHHLWRCSR
jgi:hypothetical protein